MFVMNLELLTVDPTTPDFILLACSFNLKILIFRIFFGYKVVKALKNVYVNTDFVRAVFRWVLLYYVLLKRHYGIQQRVYRE